MRIKKLQEWLKNMPGLVILLCLSANFVLQ